MNAIRRVQAPIISRMMGLRDTDLVLDVGCGCGVFTYELGKKSKCVGIDWDINDNLIYLNSTIKSIHFIKSDVHKIPFKNEVFDKVLLSSVIQLVNDEETLIKECYRVLKPGGIIVLSVPMHYISGILNMHVDILSKQFKSCGNSYYEYEHIYKLLKRHNFELIETEYSPKKLGSYVYEVGLFISLHTGLPLFHPIKFFLEYPIAYFDKFREKNETGCELIIKGRRVDV